MLSLWYNRAMLILLSALFIVSCLTLVTLFMFLKSLNELKTMMFEFISPQGDKPSRLVEFLDAIALMFTNRLVGSAEAALRGAAGGAAKAENAAARLEAFGPLAGVLGGRLGKNPVIQGLAQLVLNKFANQGNQPALSGGSHDSPKFKFGG